MSGCFNILVLIYGSLFLDSYVISFAIFNTNILKIGIQSAVLYSSEMNYSKAVTNILSAGAVTDSELIGEQLWWSLASDSPERGRREKHMNRD